MASPRRAKTEEPAEERLIRPASSLEARENQLIALAVDLAEKQLMNGTASSQVITHYLKESSTRSVLEKERLRNENLLLEAKRESMGTAANAEALYRDALNAMRSYKGEDE
jgi:hypothetical protein